MKNLILKEIKLSLHPTAFIFIGLAFMLMIPNYPYYVTFFYTGLGFFFTCITARENKDALYSILLPVKKSDIAASRCIVFFILQLIQVIVCIPVAVLHNIADMPQNEAGMEANIAFFGISFILMAIFNIIYIPMHFSDITKVGKPFAIASVIMFIAMGIEIALEYTVPFFRDVLDTPDPDNMTEKLIVLAVGIVIYIIASLMSLGIAKKKFADIDI